MRKLLLASAFGATMLISGLGASMAVAQPASVLNPDTDPSRINWAEISSSFGAAPKVAPGVRIGAVAKTLTNEYWRQLGDGYQMAAKKFGVALDLQAAQGENAQLEQLSIAQAMLNKGYKAMLLSPETNSNLQPAFEEASANGVPVVNVDDAVFPYAQHFVGNVQRDNGMRVARWFIAHDSKGGKVAVIEGMPGVYAATERTLGFEETLKSSGEPFDIVANVPGNWSRQTAYEEATTILQQHPDLIGFYANNDDMALGVVQAVIAAGKLGKVAVFGTDGIGEALKSIAAGQLTGTVDSFPQLTGQISVEVALRLLAGQKLPRVIETPQALITKANYNEYFGSGVNLEAVLQQQSQKSSN